MTRSSSPISPDRGEELGTNDRLVLDFPCKKKSLEIARGRVMEFATNHGFNSEASDIALAVQEALKNVIQHACPIDKQMHLRLYAKEDGLEVVIEDSGIGFDPERIQKGASPVMAVHGRGIRLMRGLMDEVSIESDKWGTRIRMTRKRGPGKAETG